MKKEKGITLIALIITIIIMLVLSMITINAIVGDDSALSKANQAKIQNEKGEITDLLTLAYSNIKLEQGLAQDDLANYFLTKEVFIEKGKISSVLYGFSNEEGKQYTYNQEERKVTFTIYKIGGTGTEFEYEINLDNGSIVCKNQNQGQSQGQSSGENTGNQQNTGENVNEFDKTEENATIAEVTDTEFYACDSSGNKIDGFERWFDKDLSTNISRYTGDTVKVKWNGDIIGKQIYVKTNGGSAGDFWVKYINDDGNVVNAYRPDGNVTSILNYNSGESVTYVPEGATSLLIQDYEGQDFFEIQLLENGKYNNSYLSNIKTVGVTANKIGLKWDQDSSVQEVKIYIDGIYQGTSTTNEYTIAKGLKSYTDYIIYLEPITNETTDALHNQKVKIDVKTKKDTAGFYFADINETASKRYTNWIDGNTDTYIERYSRRESKIKMDRKYNRKTNICKNQWR